MQSQHAEIRFLHAAIEKHRQNLYALELQAIDYGPLAVPLYLRNAATREQEQLALREQRLEILLAHRGPNSLPPAPGAGAAPHQDSPHPTAAQPLGASIQVSEGARLTGVSMVVGSQIAGDVTQTMHWGS